MMRSDLLHLHRRQRGSTLLEALIAMVVVAFGLLGVLALQLYTIKGTQSSHLTSQLTLQAYELFDLMRANRQAALDGAYNDGATGERARWQKQVAAMLGSGSDAKLQRNGRLFTLTITWNDGRGAVLDDQGNASSDATGGTLVLSTEI
ncbi:type IVa pilus pseudopilin TppB [Marinobacterium maritimum]|uniref:Type IVa pilus pseudopilin TppB n=1 Tax=Marinobacterium maritimum TaxID=500162 RepID=A0ABN1I6R1_9GAMM